MGSERTERFKQVVASLGTEGTPIVTAPTFDGELRKVAPFGLGEVLAAACHDRTAGLHMLVGFFSHSPEKGTGSTPEEIVSAEMLELNNRVESVELKRSSMSLAYGQLRSEESKLAIQAWYWICLWKRHRSEAAEAWLNSAVAEVVKSTLPTDQLFTRLASSQEFRDWLSSFQGQWEMPIASFHDTMQRMGSSAGLAAASRLLALFAVRKAAVRSGAAQLKRGLFHPKVFVVERGVGSPNTIVLAGSGNWSASALTANSAKGNVELGVAYKVDGHPWAGCPGPAADGQDVGTRIVVASKWIFDHLCAPLASWFGAEELPSPHQMLELTQVEQMASPVVAEVAGRDLIPEALAGTLKLVRDMLAKKVGEDAVGLLPLAPPRLDGIAPYQEAGAERLAAILKREGGAILADGTGLGKTWIAMRVIDDFIRKNPHGSKVVVVAPNATTRQWSKELAEQRLTRVHASSGDTSEIVVVSHGSLQMRTLSQEHLAICDAALVVIDEAHNFRNSASSRWKRLRWLLERRNSNEHKKQVLLLTATPINNSLDDLLSLLALMKIPPDRKGQLIRRNLRIGTEFSGLTDWAKVKPEVGPFDLGDDERLRNIDVYFKEESRKLADLKSPNDRHGDGKRPRILEELLGRIMVRRNREQCRELDQDKGATTLLFRERPSSPETVRLGIADSVTATLLRDFLSGFEDSESPGQLSLAVHQWNLHPEEAAQEGRSALLGLQRVLLLKRLESSQVALMQSLTRLAALHARRLVEARQAGLLPGDGGRISADVDDLVVSEQFATLLRLAGVPPASMDPLEHLARSHSGTGEESAVEGSLLGPSGENLDEDDEDGTDELALAIQRHAAQQDSAGLRTWRIQLLPTLVSDLSFICGILHRLAQSVFGPPSSWPTGLIGRSGLSWPAPADALRHGSVDEKLGHLLRQLCIEHENRGKTVVFTQFADTLHDIRAVFDALRQASPAEIDRFIEASRLAVSSNELMTMVRATAFVTGDGALLHPASELQPIETALRNFCPYYQLGIKPPDEHEKRQRWAQEWHDAAANPIDVMITTDVLSEGVNLQDATCLIHYDFHWNPVRMVQRAGRIDRRLSPAVEFPPGGNYPALLEVFPDLSLTPPRYAWSDRRSSRVAGNVRAPRYVNLLLPQVLDDKLRLCATIARKHLAIRRTIGIDCDLGIPDTQVEDTYRTNVLTSSDLRPLSSAVEEAALELAKVDSFFLRAAPSNLSDNPVRVWRHPGTRPEDPYVLMADWQLGNEVGFSLGWLAPVISGPNAVAEWLTPVRLTVKGPNDHLHVVSWDKGRPISASQPGISQRHILNEVDLGGLVRLLRRVFDGVQDPRGWRTDGCSLNPQLATAAASAFFWALASKNKRRELVEMQRLTPRYTAFRAVQLPEEMLQKELKQVKRM